MEIIFVMEQELLKINVEKNLTKNLEAIKRQLIDEHMKRVEALEFSISKNLRLSRYEEAKVGLTELLALALKHEYSRKQWINKNLLTVDKLMKEKRHGI
ncbi:MAG: hypothetical protein EP319_12695 [Deltaproteobacteria bacterium]|nr:MAG: hypothetical protein EP319_12695 [Deltaproteobacteria bacterium]